MNKNSILRTSAILYAEDSKNIDPVIIKRKMIESIFVITDNKKAAIHEIVDNLKKHLDLYFTEEEIVGIINSTKEGYFDIIPHKEISKYKVQLTTLRYRKLNEKVEALSLDDIIELFGIDIYKGEIKTKHIKDILHRYIYFLINTNHNTLTKILTGKHSEGDISLCEADFAHRERDLINQFIGWDNSSKNKTLYMLISYSMEYCFVVNNTNGADFFQSMKDKIFYLDNSIIYRALGINGEIRKSRTLSFLDKCVENGQSFIISKFTNKEFNNTIAHHIKHLGKLPAAKINPELFELFNLNSEVAKFYYSWKAGRTADSCELFQLHIDSIYRQFTKKYSIAVEKTIPYEISTEKHKNKIKDLVSQIELAKQNGQYGSHEVDAENVLLVEYLRNGEDSTLSETKYYFISTDQRLRNWDYDRSDFQPIILLPSHWLSLLLRYVKRTDSDYSAFTSFLKLKNGNAYLKVEHLDQILTGISNITNDFESQAIIAVSMLEKRFDKILEGLPDVKQIEEIEAFAEKELDIHFKRQKEINEQQKFALAQEYEDTIKRIENEKDETLKNEIIKSELQGLNKLLNEKELRSTEKEEIQLTQFKQKNKLDKKAHSRLKFVIGAYLIILIAYIVVMIIMVNKYEFVSKYWGFISLFYLLINYISSYFIGKSLNPMNYISSFELRFKSTLYDNYGFNIDSYDKIGADIMNLKNEIEQIKRTIALCCINSKESHVLHDSSSI